MVRGSAQAETQHSLLSQATDPFCILDVREMRGRRQGRLLTLTQVFRKDTAHSAVFGTESSSPQTSGGPNTVTDAS